MLRRLAPQALAAETDEDNLAAGNLVVANLVVKGLATRRTEMVRERTVNQGRAAGKAEMDKESVVAGLPDAASNCLQASPMPFGKAWPVEDSRKQT